MTRKERMLKYYPYIHLFGNIYIVRRHAREAKKCSLWQLMNLSGWDKEVIS